MAGFPRLPAPPESDEGGPRLKYFLLHAALSPTVSNSHQWSATVTTPPHQDECRFVWISGSRSSFSSFASVRTSREFPRLVPIRVDSCGLVVRPLLPLVCHSIPIRG